MKSQPRSASLILYLKIQFLYKSKEEYTWWRDGKLDLSILLHEIIREDSNLFYLLSFQVSIRVSFVIFFAYLTVTQNNLILISSLSYNTTGIIFIFTYI